MVGSKVRDAPSPTKILALLGGSGEQEAGTSLQGREGLHCDHEMTPRLSSGPDSTIYGKSHPIFLGSASWTLLESDPIPPIERRENGRRVMNLVCQPWLEENSS